MVFLKGPDTYMDENGSVPAHAGFSGVRIWGILSLVVLIAAIMFIPARIGSLGFLPPDDAGRHIAKAISGKSWNEILVMRPEIITDMWHGWDALLAFLHKHAGLGPDALMAFSMTLCFILFAALPLFFLRRPEAWIAALGVVAVFEPYLLYRVFLGRPFIISSALLAALLFKWEKFAGKKPDWIALGLFTGAMTVNSWLVPTAAYLFCIPLLGFALAREWRALARIGICLIIGCIAGYELTGYPFQLAQNVFYMVTAAPDQNLLSRMLVTELMPETANFCFWALITGIIAVRIYRKRWGRAVIDNPVFFNIVCGSLLVFFVGRFWRDWGMIAAFVWIARELQLLSEEFLVFNSRKRFMTVGILTGCFFIILTSDVQSRWSEGVPRYPLVYETAKEDDKGWFPDSGGIFYNESMAVFYRTIFYNPQAPWRYVLGFEPVLMNPEDLKVFRNIQRSCGALDSYEPWIKKMTSRDRMVFVTGAQPPLTALEWKCVNRNTWLGRLPRKELTDAGPVKKR
jgi:hypothetical protein